MLRYFLPELEWVFTSTSPRSPCSLRAASRFSTSFFNQMTYMSNSPFLFPLQIPCRGYSRLRSIMRYGKYSIVGYKSQAQTKNQYFCCFYGLNYMDSRIKIFSSFQDAKLPILFFCLIFPYPPIAKWAEKGPLKPKVLGSIPSGRIWKN